VLLAAQTIVVIIIDPGLLNPTMNRRGAARGRQFHNPA
jgi:hypothetical protein